MAIFTHYMTQIVADVSSYFEHGDVQSTTIAIGVASSLAITVLWFLVHIVNLMQRQQQQQQQQDSKNKVEASAVLQDACKKISVVSAFHVNRKGSGGNINKQHLHRFSRVKNRSIWSSRQVEKKCSVPCIRCGMSSADKLCRYVLCQLCCLGNSATVCNFHGDLPCPHIEKLGRKEPTKMDLSNSSLEECPARVGYMGAQLVSLNLSHNTLRKLPEEIGCLLGLKNLHLQNNQIETLPDSIGNLSKLEELNLSHNHLVSLPASIGSLSGLKELIIEYNHLHSLPPTLGKLAHLEDLCAGDNKLKSLPKEICTLSKLMVLNVRNNQLRSLPCTGMDRLVRLIDLNVSNNQLTHLPWHITRCSSLIKLILSGNRLKKLPCQLGRLHLLFVLEINDNKLRYLPASIDALNPPELTGNLATFKLRNNCFLTESEKEKKPCSESRVCVILPLLDLAARIIVKKGIAWQTVHLPQELTDMLLHHHHCSSCGEPLFEHYQENITFRQMESHSVPLYQQICLPSPLATPCRFIQLQQKSSP